ncbi:MAG: MarR family transcriptional regulator [Chloroflexota bacterium]|nr:MarR family transcriptional regulator [Chloroflexota bacterium]PLS83064.1 MAG: hypothetical protein CYG59_02395 [Chloroflexota bacterium]
MNHQAGTDTAHEELSEVLSVFVAQVLHCDTDTLLRFVRQAELTLPLLAVLALVERQGASSIGEIGVRLNYTLANASLLVDKLVCLEYVTRVENAKDRRHKLVQLTPKGQAVLAGLQAARAETMAQQLLQLPLPLVTQTITLLRSITDELSKTQLPTVIVETAAD